MLPTPPSGLDSSRALTIPSLADRSSEVADAETFDFTCFAADLALTVRISALIHKTLSPWSYIYLLQRFVSRLVDYCPVQQTFYLMADTSSDGLLTSEAQQL